MKVINVIKVMTHLRLYWRRLTVAVLANGLHQTIVKVEMCKTRHRLGSQNSRHLASTTTTSWSLYTVLCLTETTK